MRSSEFKKSFTIEDRIPKDINSVADHRKKTPLMKAAYNGDLKLTRTLIESKADLDLTDNEGNTALLLAIKNKKQEVVKFLISANTNLNIQNFNKKNALLYAIDEQDLSLLSTLLKAKANTEMVNEKGNTPLMYAISKRLDNVAKVLIGGGAKVNHRNRNGESAIDFAITEKSQVLQVLIEAKADLNKLDHYDNTPLMLAINEKNTEAALMLIEAGANLNLKNSSEKTAFDHAIAKKNYIVITAIVDAHADLLNPPYNGENTPLMELIKRGDTENAIKLINQGANLNSLNSSGSRALDFAIKYENEKVLEAIIQAKGDLNYQDELKRTPLFQAIEKDSINIAHILVKAGVQLNAEGHQERVLESIFRKNNIALLKTLIEAKVDLNYLNSWKETLLTRAIDNGNTEFAMALIDGGADLAIKNNWGNNAFDVAMKKKNFVIATYILDHGFNLPKKDIGSLVAEFKPDENAYAFLGILKDPFKPVPEMKPIYDEAINQLKKLTKPEEKFSIIEAQVLSAVDEGTGNLAPFDIAKLIASYDDSRYRLFNHIQKVESYAQPTDAERKERREECLIM